MGFTIETLEKKIRENEIDLSDVEEELERHLHTYKMFTKALENESTPESLKEFLQENRKRAKEAARKVHYKMLALEEKDEELNDAMMKKRLEWLDLPSWEKVLMS